MCTFFFIIHARAHTHTKTAQKGIIASSRKRLHSTHKNFKMQILLLLLIAFIECVFASRPNIIFFLADDLGWNDVSYHGSAQIPTPNLDRLARSGVRLSSYYVNPVCSPTRASLMSGRSMMHTGIQTPYGDGNNAAGLNLSYTILPERKSFSLSLRLN